MKNELLNGDVFHLIFDLQEGIYLQIQRDFIIMTSAVLIENIIFQYYLNRLLRWRL